MAKQQARKKRRADRREDRRVLLWLLGCFPFGLVLMWRRGCRWPLAAKCAVSAVLAWLVLAIVLPQTAPKQKASGGIQLVGVNPEVEVYGPELPVLIVPGYTNDQPQSIIVNEDEEANQVHYVYAAEGAKCYHEYECKFAFASSQRLTVYEAYFLGFKPCPRCNPPKYNGVP